MDYPKSDATARLHPSTEKFTDGDVGGGIPASKDSADYQNMVFDEILAVITVAGLTPDEEDVTQLWQAISLLSVPEASSAEVLSGSNVDKFVPPDLLRAAQQKFGIGWDDNFLSSPHAIIYDPAKLSPDWDTLVQGGWYKYLLDENGNNAPQGVGGAGNTQLFVVRRNDDAVQQFAYPYGIESDAGYFWYRAKNTNWSAWRRIITDADFASSLNANGYINLPGGLILQWGSVPAAGVTTSITFPIAFPNNIFNLSAKLQADSTTAADERYVKTSSLTGGVFTTYTAFGSMNWMAIGN